MKTQDTIAPRGSVRVGDRYHRRDLSASVEIMRVTETHVYWVICGGGARETSRKSTLEKFLQLERNSLKWGAEFEPAQKL